MANEIESLAPPTSPGAMTLETVAYLVFDEFDWPAGHRADEVHELDLGAILTFNGGHELAVRWAMEGEREGLWVGFAPHGGIEVAEHVVRQPVSSRWEHVLGRSLSGVTAVNHASNDGSTAAAAVRLMFDGGVSLTFALGEERDGQLAYQPDGILVFFDERAADQFVQTTYSQRFAVPRT